MKSDVFWATIQGQETRILLVGKKQAIQFSIFQVQPLKHKCAEQKSKDFEKISEEIEAPNLQFQKLIQFKMRSLPPCYIHSTKMEQRFSNILSFVRLKTIQSKLLEQIQLHYLNPGSNKLSKYIFFALQQPSQAMQQIERDLTRLLEPLYNQHIFMRVLSRVEEQTRLKYVICSVQPYYSLIKDICSCVVITCYLDWLKNGGKIVSSLEQVQKRRNQLNQKIKENIGLLTMEGMLKQNTKFESISIISTKIISQAMNVAITPKIPEDEIYVKVNSAVCGKIVSVKCYKVILGKLARKPSIGRKSFKNLTRRTLSQKTHRLNQQIPCQIENTASKILTKTHKNLPIIGNQKFAHQKVQDVLQKVRRTLSQKILTVTLNKYAQKPANKSSDSTNKPKNLQILSQESLLSDERLIKYSTVKKNSRRKAIKTKHIQVQSPKHSKLTLNDLRNSKSRWTHNSTINQVDSTIQEEAEEWFRSVQQAEPRKMFTLQLPPISGLKIS